MPMANLTAVGLPQSEERMTTEGENARSFLGHGTILRFLRWPEPIYLRFGYVFELITQFLATEALGKSTLADRR